MKKIVFLYWIALAAAFFAAPSHIKAQNDVVVQPLTTPADFEYKCTMHDNNSVYYVMPDKTVRNSNNDIIGKTELPPRGREKEFTYMITLPEITYAVDQYGNVWAARYPFKEIVGKTEPGPKAAIKW